MSSLFEQLTTDQQAALITFRLQNGRNWKQKLLDGWQKAAYPGALQQIRNSLGPEWLIGLKHVPDYRLEVAIRTVDECDGFCSISLDAHGRLIEGLITWSPHEPDFQTELVTLECYDGDELKERYVVDGDFWRQLDDFDLSEDFFEKVLKGERIEEAVASMRFLSENKIMV